MMPEPDTTPVALITGAARRIGAAIADEFHHRGFRVLLHCRSSRAEAEARAAGFNRKRPESAAVLGADLATASGGGNLGRDALARFQRLDVLVNNASGYYPTTFGEVGAAQWEDLQGSNLRGHFFLSQAVAAELRSRNGAIVNISDVHTGRPPRYYSAYAIAKAGVEAMTRSLAIELAPQARVNAIAPGAILWPESLADESVPGVAAACGRILRSIPLRTTGTPEQVAALCHFLAVEANYLTGQTIRIDGGRHLG